MSGTYIAGETKDRPGVYHRYVNTGTSEIAETQDGIGCAVVQGNWGALGKAVTIDADTDVESVIGTGSGNEVITEMINGGADEIVVVRIGSGGTNSTITLADDGGTSVVTLTALYPGAREFTITIKTSLDDETVRTATIYEGTTQLETVSFTAGDTEVDAIVEAFADSSYVTAEKVADGTGTLADVSQSAFTVGTDPDVDTESYSDGFEIAEAEDWDVLCVDSSDSAVHLLAASFCERIYEYGAYPMMCVAETSDVDIETRKANALAFNSEKVVYVLNSWENADGDVYEGYLAAARIGGMICGISAADSLTHKIISDGTVLHEALTNAQIISALKSGCLVISMNKSRQIQIEKAINTLVELSDEQDAGWKKIRRVKTRYELMNRIDTKLDPMIGTVDNDADGRAAIIAAAQAVGDAMIGEKKLISCSVTEDGSLPASGDSAWFIIAVDDLDSIETIYLQYQFRFAAED